MNTNILRYVAVALGLGVAAVTVGQSANADWNAYRAPSHWSQFNPSQYTVAKPNMFRTVGSNGVNAVAAETPLPQPMRDIAAPVADAGATVGSGCAPCQSGHSSAYVDAARAPWGHQANCGACECGDRSAIGFGHRNRGGLYPWFGGIDLLFLTLENNSDRVLLIDDATATPQFSTSSSTLR